MFVVEGLMIICAPQDFSGGAQKATEVMSFMLHACCG